jgi:hypothetical protein
MSTDLSMSFSSVDWHADEFHPLWDRLPSCALLSSPRSCRMRSGAKQAGGARDGVETFTGARHRRRLSRHRVRPG